MVETIKDKYSLRLPWPQLADVDHGDYCAQSASIVLVNDFVKFASKFDSVDEAITKLRCMTDRVCSQHFTSEFILIIL